MARASLRGGAWRWTRLFSFGGFPTGDLIKFGCHRLDKLGRHILFFHGNHRDNSPNSWDLGLLIHKPFKPSFPADRSDHEPCFRLLGCRFGRPELEPKIPQRVLRFRHIRLPQTVRKVGCMPRSGRRRRSGAGWLGALDRGNNHEIRFVLRLLNLKPASSELTAHQLGKLIGFGRIVHVEICNNCHRTTLRFFSGRIPLRQLLPGERSRSPQAASPGSKRMTTDAKFPACGTSIRMRLQSARTEHP